MFELYFLVGIIIGIFSGYFFLKNMDIDLGNILMSGLISFICILVWPMVVMGFLIAFFVILIRRIKK